MNRSPSHWMRRRYEKYGRIPARFNPAESTGGLLRYVRATQDLSFERMAEQAHMDKSMIVRMATGERRGSYEVMRALATALPVPQWQQDAVLASAGYLPTAVRQGWRESLHEVATAVNVLSASPLRLQRFERQITELARESACQEEISA